MAARDVGRIARPLDPDDIGAPVRQLPHADRPGPGMGQVEDDEILQARAKPAGRAW